MPFSYLLRFYSVLAVLALGPGLAFGQTLPSPGPRICATQEVDALQQAQLQKLVPGYNSAKAAAPLSAKALRTAATTYTLPVIVHVIHTGEAVGVGSNISQAQVQSQLEVLNEDYRNLNADGALVPSVFQPVRGDMQLQFVPASYDPSGRLLPEPGIDRVDRTAKGWSAPPYAASYIDGTIKPSSYWDPDRYINIWVLDLSGGVLGYAQFPDNTAGLAGLSPLGGTAATDGVVILYSAFGRVGTLVANYNKGRTLTHELGHWLGLRHVWGDANCGNDYCTDTPTQQTSNYGCPTFPHVTCSNGPNGDMFMNYMDYVNDACMQLFTVAQKERMQAVMAAGTPRRSILATSQVACASIVAATATNSGAVCPGGTVRLAANGPAGATYAWTGPNGFTSTAQNPVLTGVTAAMAGTYAVRVDVTTGACPVIATTQVALTTAPPAPTLASPALAVCPGTPTPLSATNLTGSPLPSEDFNGAAPGWLLANNGVASTGWQFAQAYSYSSTYFTLSNYSLDGSRFVLANSDIGGSGSVTNTTLTSPAFSTLGYATLQLAFQQRYAYASGDVAVVEASTDGTTWAPVATYTSNQGSATAPATTTLALGAYANQPSVQVRWRYTTSWAYYWAIDNVQFTGTPIAITYAWTLVSGDGLPSPATTPTVVVTPTQPSVYRLSVSYGPNACAAAATLAIGIVPPVWTGAAGTGNWFDAGNWTGCVPTRTTDALIPAGLTTPYPTIASGTAEVRTLTQQGPLTLTGGELDFYGDYTGRGAFSQRGGTVAIRGTGAQSLRAGTYQTLEVGGTGTKTIGAATIGQMLRLSGGVLNTGTDTLALASSATITETDASYVLGRVRTTHTVGTATDNFGGLGVTLTPTAAPGATTVVRTTGQAQGAGAATSISRYYDIAAATNRSLQSATLALSYLPHELNSLAATQLVLFYSTNGGASWTNQGATLRDATTSTVSRNYVTTLAGRWTLGSDATPLTPAPLTYAITALPVPFAAEGLSLQVTTPTAGPLTAQLYDVVGRVLYHHTVANVEAGTSTVVLPNSGLLAPGQYILLVQQASQAIRVNVVRGQ